MTAPNAGGTVDGAQLGDVICRAVGLVFAHRHAATGLLGFGLEH